MGKLKLVYFMNFLKVTKFDLKFKLNTCIPMIMIIQINHQMQVACRHFSYYILFILRLMVHELLINNSFSYRCMGR